MRRKNEDHIFHVEVASDGHGTVRMKCAEWGVERVVAISGGVDAPADVDPDAYGQKIENLIKDILFGMQSLPIALLCGGTDDGVPLFAARAARAAGKRVIGVYADCGKKYSLGSEDLDLAIQVGPIGDRPYWGDESPLFATIPDAVVVVGGGAGTLVEVAHFLKVNETLTKPKGDDQPIRIIPVEGTHGVADIIRQLPMKERVRKHALPDRRIVTAADVTAELIRHFEAKPAT